MKTIGITGGIGSGKSTVARILDAAGVRVVSSDTIVHRLLTAPSPYVEEIGRRFGADTVMAGGVDRKMLGRMVFADPDRREELNRLLHPAVAEELRREKEAAEREGLSHLVLEIPLLFETGMESLVDRVWVVTAPEELRLLRLGERTGLSGEELRRRMEAQWPEARKAARADVLIVNDGSYSELRETVLSRWQEERVCED